MQALSPRRFSPGRLLCSLACIFFVLTVLSAQARLGDTASECADRYGMPKIDQITKINEKNFPLLPGAVNHTYICKGWKIRVAFLEIGGPAVRIEYRKAPGAVGGIQIKDTESEAILGTETPNGTRWTRLGLSTNIADFAWPTRWQRSDCAIAKSNGLVLQLELTVVNQQQTALKQQAQQKQWQSVQALVTANGGQSTTVAPTPGSSFGTTTSPVTPHSPPSKSADRTSQPLRIPSFSTTTPPAVLSKPFTNLPPPPTPRVFSPAPELQPAIGDPHSSTSAIWVGITVVVLATGVVYFFAWPHLKKMGWLANQPKLPSEILIERMGKRYGPFSVAEVHEQLRTGKLSQWDLAYGGESVGWVTLFEMLEKRPSSAMDSPQAPSVTKLNSQTVGANAERSSASPTIDTVRWDQFELVIAEAYRRMGYTVEICAALGADGGVDVKLMRDGAVTLVQCKQWKAWKVKVPAIREFFGVLTAEGAQRGIFITSGKFTKDCYEFAQGKPIDLLSRPAIEELVRNAEVPGENLGNVASGIHRFIAGARIVMPECPFCHRSMVLRHPKANESFWGCSNFPKCRGKRDARLDLLGTMV